MSTLLITNVGSPHSPSGPERGRAEELLPERVLEPLGELGLHVVLELDEQVGVADEVGHVHLAGLLLEGVLDLLAERVADEVVPAVGRVGLVPEAELLVEVAQLDRCSA